MAMINKTNQKGETMATLSNDTGGGVDFITVFDGKLVQRVPQGTEGATPRKLTKGDNEGKEVFEKHYTSVSGMITGGGIEVKQFGNKKVKEIHIKLDEDVLLQLPMHLLSSFAKPLPNVDPSIPVKVNVYKNKRGKTGLNISQDGEKCDWFYTKDHPNGLPQPIFDDMDEWDFRDHDKFLILKVQQFFAEIDEINGVESFEENPKKVADVPENDQEIPF